MDTKEVVYNCICDISLWSRETEIGTAADLSVAREQAQNRQGHHGQEDDSEQPVQQFLPRAIDPVTEQRGKQQGLGHHFQPASELKPDRHRSVSHAFDRSGRRPERGQNAKRDQHPCHEQPAIPPAKQQLPERIEDQSEDQAAKWLE